MNTKDNTQGTAPTGGAIIADRFKLDTTTAARRPDGVGKTSAMIAMVAALLTTALMGAVAALMYVNWDLIKDV